MRKSTFYILLKKHVVLLLAIIYLLNPLQHQLMEGLHTFSHVLTHTDYLHHHEEDHLLGHEHTHQHKIITAFSKIFSSEKDHDNPNEVLLDFKVDKHFSQSNSDLVFLFKIFQKHTFFYIPKTYFQKTTIPTPPPEIFFS